ncbi:MAG: hypothetical protein JJ959_19515 [Nisaea sp.]|uniref:hypothetical protein n=1 Tax=Nisaea sp. TaxID=2024842 RepID=UPI001B2AD9DD|nr:hypothetical protein [Nisaea sp.]MBO6562746.1 hypothetical protein [Nisaea sp.]
MKIKKKRNARSNSPVVSKGTAFPFQVSVTCWVDLLGYGSMISQANYNPLNDTSNLAVARIEKFHQLIAQHTNRYFPALILNDGAVIYRDLSLRSRSVTYDFFVRCFRLFEDINDLENQNNFPGARMILAAGFRLRKRPIKVVSHHNKSILRRYREGRITAEEAIHEAAKSRDFAESIPELQSNFAFTKSYVADTDGTKGGLVGPNFYVDDLLFSSIPTWLIKEDLVHWKNEKLKLSASFVPVISIDKCNHPSGGPTEIRSGLEVAQILSDDPNVLSALRSKGKLRDQ